MSKQAPPQVRPKSIDALIPYARNARTHSDEQVSMIAASLVEFGWTNPVLVGPDGGIIAGHGRVMAARKVLAAGGSIPNWPDTDTVPTIELAHLTPAQRRAYVLADNQLATRAGWDADVLAVELDELRDEGFDLSLLGFEQQELNDLIGTANTGPEQGSGSGSLAGKFMLPPFSVLNAREGWWQDRKRAWIALGIKSELGRGMGSMELGPPTVTKNEDGTLNYGGTKGQAARFDAQRRGGGAEPGGSARPAADYSKRQRGAGNGRAI